MCSWSTGCLRTQIPHLRRNEGSPLSRFCFWLLPDTLNKRSRLHPLLTAVWRPGFRSSEAWWHQHLFDVCFSSDVQRSEKGPANSSSLTSLSPQCCMISLWTHVTCGCSLYVSRYLLFTGSDPPPPTLAISYITTSHPLFRRDGIHLHTGAAPTPSRLYHHLWRQNVGRTIQTPHAGVCASHTEQSGGILTEQGRLQQAVCKAATGFVSWNYYCYGYNLFIAVFTAVNNKIILTFNFPWKLSKSYSNLNTISRYLLEPGPTGTAQLIFHPGNTLTRDKMTEAIWYSVVKRVEFAM